MSEKKNQHVAPHPGGRVVKPEGARRASSVHRTQQKAISRGREISRNQGSELLIHGRDGQIRERDTHGRDPFPLKG